MLRGLAGVDEPPVPVVPPDPGDESRLRKTVNVVPPAPVRFDRSQQGGRIERLLAEGQQHARMSPKFRQDGFRMAQRADDGVSRGCLRRIPRADQLQRPAEQPGAEPRQMEQIPRSFVHGKHVRQVDVQNIPGEIDPVRVPFPRARHRHPVVRAPGADRLHPERLQAGRNGIFRLPARFGRVGQFNQWRVAARGSETVSEIRSARRIRHTRRPVPARAPPDNPTEAA